MVDDEVIICFLFLTSPQKARTGILQRLGTFSTYLVLLFINLITDE